MKPGEESELVVRQALDLLDRRKLVRVTSASLVIFAAATACAWYLLEAFQHAPVIASPPVTPAVAPPQMGTVETTLILTTERGLTLNAQRRHKLEHYGWVDRDAGIARIPIDRAMELLWEGNGADGGAP